MTSHTDFISPSMCRFYLSSLSVVSSSGVGEMKGQQPASQAELERQQILKEMKKKTPLLTDSSWIRQRSANTATNKEFDMPNMRRYASIHTVTNITQRVKLTQRAKLHLCCVMVAQGLLM